MYNLDGRIWEEEHCKHRVQKHSTEICNLETQPYRLYISHKYLGARLNIDPKPEHCFQNVYYELWQKYSSNYLPLKLFSPFDVLCCIKHVLKIRSAYFEVELSRFNLLYCCNLIPSSQFFNIFHFLTFIFWLIFDFVCLFLTGILFRMY